MNDCCEHARAAIYDKRSRVGGWTVECQQQQRHVVKYRLPENVHDDCYFGREVSI